MPPLRTSPQNEPMHHPARPLGRFGVFPSVVGVVAAVVALSPPANADPDLFEPPPSIVAGGTVQPGSNGSNIVVDPKHPLAHRHPSIPISQSVWTQG